MAERPSPYALWVEAGGSTKEFDPSRYRELLREYGDLLKPGDEGYDETARNLPCGWPGRDEISSATGMEPQS